MSLEFITSESVTKGHPDKLCDQIADAVLDEILKKDPKAHVACEVTATTGLIHVFGEISTNCYVDIPTIARRTVNSVGYNDADCYFNGSTCAVITSISSQSSDIAMGVDESCEYKTNAQAKNIEKIGAGDQGIMYGFACKETASFMPLPIFLANKITKALSDLREKSIVNFLKPDGKAQVTLSYVDGKPDKITKIVISTQHSECVTHSEICKFLKEHIICNNSIIPQSMIDKSTAILVNPTGRFVVGGPAADSGLTGRKLMVDTYGGVAHHGGGAFSGKDPTKVDRSGAYMARYVAKNIVASGIANRCEVSVCYAIGVAKPVCIYVNSFGTSSYSNQELTKMTERVFDFRPAAIIENFDLRRPIYQQLAAYGHFGRDELDLPWERLDKVNEIFNNI